MSLGQHRYWVLLINFHINIFTSSLASLAALDIDCNRLLDGELNSTLGDETKIGTGESVGILGDEVNVDILSNRSLAQLSLDDAGTRGQIG